MMVSGGNMQTELDEIEFGTRVTIMLDQENSCWGPVDMLFWHTIDYGRDQFVRQKRDRNPIRKIRPNKWKVQGRVTYQGNPPLWQVTHHAVGDPWVATCFECGETLQRFRSRKTAKDALYRHRREAHG